MGGWGRRVVLFGSIGLHVAAAIGLLATSLLHVEELAPPETTLTLFNAQAPAAPAATLPAARSVLGKKRARAHGAKPKGHATPEEHGSDRSATPPATEEHASDPGSGQPSGASEPGPAAPGPAVSAPPPPPPPAPKAPATGKLIPSFVLDRERIRAPEPRVPEDFARAHAKQTLYATYRICVGVDGKVTGASVVSSLGGGDEAILAQIARDWLYKPQPVPVCSVRVFVFKID